MKGVDKLKYEMDQIIIVDDTEQARSWFTDGRAGRRTNKVKPVYPLNFVGGGMIINQTHFSFKLGCSLIES